MVCTVRSVGNVEAIGRFGHDRAFNEQGPELQKAFKHLLDGVVQTIERIDRMLIERIVLVDIIPVDGGPTLRSERGWPP